MVPWELQESFILLVESVNSGSDSVINNIIIISDKYRVFKVKVL